MQFISNIVNDFLKVGLSPFKKKIICFSDSPSKKMKNPFYFILKALSVLKRFKFLVLTFWECRKNGLIRKIRLTAQSCKLKKY